MPCGSGTRGIFIIRFKRSIKCSAFFVCAVPLLSALTAYPRAHADIRPLNKQINQSDDEKKRKQIKVRYNEQKSLANSIKGSTYVQDKAPQNLTVLQSQRLSLIAESLAKLYKSYKLKEELRLILKWPIKKAVDCLKRWYWRVTHSKIWAIGEVVLKIKRHTNNILNMLRSGLSNAEADQVAGTALLRLSEFAKHVRLRQADLFQGANSAAKPPLTLPQVSSKSLFFSAKNLQILSGFARSRQFASGTSQIPAPVQRKHCFCFRQLG